MSVLTEISAKKRLEVAERRELYPVKLLEQSCYFTTPVVSLKRYLARPDKVGIIAEIKRRSPSRGILNQYISVEQLSIGYMQAGASALSVLTDSEFFGGSNADLTVARRFNFCPILRKDFIIDEYQVLETRSIGADVILLIAALLEPERLRALAVLARSLGLEVLLEVHSRAELESADPALIDLVGVNNRNLNDFSVTVERALVLSAALPPELPKLAESGIGSAAAIGRLKRAGYSGFLIGEAFMGQSEPQQACRKLIIEVQRELEHGCG